MKKIFLFILFSVFVFGANHIVDQKKKSFIPKTLKVKVGDNIIFKNSDTFAHNAYTDNEENEFDIGMQKPNQDIKVFIKARGKFNVECAIHPNMLLEVEAE